MTETDNLKKLAGTQKVKMVLSGDDDGNIWLEFDQPVAKLRLPPYAARHLAKQLGFFIERMKEKQNDVSHEN